MFQWRDPLRSLGGEFVSQAILSSKMNGSVTGLAFSNEDRYVVSSSRDMTVKVHDAKTGELFTTYTGHTRQYKAYTGRFRVYDVVFDSKTRSLLSAGEGRAIRLWDAEKARAENGTAGDMEKRFSVEGHTRYLDHHFKHTASSCLRETGTCSRPQATAS